MKKEIFCILCSLFCFGYCLLIFSIHTGTRFYLVWGAGAVFFLGLFFFFHFHLWDQLPSWLQKTTISVILIGLLLFLLVEACIVSQFRARAESNLDYLIVLGAQIKENGPSAALKYRLDAAYNYLIENENTICIVSGGQGANEPCSEAQGMMDYLVDKGISQNRILLEKNSTSTLENLTFSSEFFDKENSKIGIVTNNFHVFRSIHVAKHLGFQNVSGLAAGSDIYFQLNNMVREFLGIIKDFLFGNLA